MLKSLLLLPRRLKIGPKLTVGFGILITLMLAGYEAVLQAGRAPAGAIGRDIARPILRLAGTAQQIQAGDLAAQVEVNRTDGIGLLGTAFNAFTTQLRQTLQSLLDNLEQVKIVMSAAAAVEEDRFDPASLDGLSRRTDALGQRARVFQKLAREVRLREEKLKQQVKELKIVLDEKRQDQKVAEITESQYFKSLQSKADTLRDLLAGVVEDAGKLRRWFS